MDLLTQTLQNVPAGTGWAVVAALAVSLILQALKKWLELQSDKVINFLLGVLSFSVVAINYLTQAVSQNPTVLGQRTFIVMGVATTLYNFLIKPTNIVLKDAKAYRERKNRIADQAVAGTVPIESVVPIVTPVESSADSSDTFQA